MEVLNYIWRKSAAHHEELISLARFTIGIDHTKTIELRSQKSRWISANSLHFGGYFQKSTFSMKTIYAFSYY